MHSSLYVCVCVCVCVYVWEQRGADGEALLREDAR